MNPDPVPLSGRSVAPVAARPVGRAAEGASRQMRTAGRNTRPFETLAIDLGRVGRRQRTTEAVSVVENITALPAFTGVAATP